MVLHIIDDGYDPTGSGLEMVMPITLEIFIDAAGVDTCGVNVLLRLKSCAEGAL
jgi:hypothetical protein